MSIKSSAGSGSRTSHTLGKRWGSEKSSLSERKTVTLPVRAMRYSSVRQQAKSPSPPEIVDEDGERYTEYSTCCIPRGHMAVTCQLCEGASHNSHMIPPLRCGCSSAPGVNEQLH